jgi:hypothetical protein
MTAEKMAPFNLSGVATLAQMAKSLTKNTGRHHFKFNSESINKLDCLKE